MDPMLVKLWELCPIAGAFVFSIIIFMRHIEKKDNDQIKRDQAFMEFQKIHDELTQKLFDRSDVQIDKNNQFIGAANETIRKCPGYTEKK